MPKTNDNLQSSLYATIKSKIINCEIKPGEKIDEKEILGETGSSKTPFREAIIMLKAEGLAEVRPRYGFFATELTGKDVAEVFELRKILEPEIALKYFENADISKLIDINNAMKEISDDPKKYEPKKMADLDFDFHRFFVNCSENIRLKEMMEPLLEHARRITMFNSWTTEPGKPWDSAIRQHDEIITALFTQDRTNVLKAYNIHFNHYKAKSYKHLQK